MRGSHSVLEFKGEGSEAVIAESECGQAFFCKGDVEGHIVGPDVAGGKFMQVGGDPGFGGGGGSHLQEQVAGGGEVFVSPYEDALQFFFVNRFHL